MAMDKLEIINRSLSKVGLPRAASLDDCDWNAQEVYENMVQECLRSFPWSFAQIFATLSASDTAPKFGFTFAYALPAACLRLMDIRMHADLRAPRARYQITGREVYTNVKPCNARYITDLQDPADWTPDFCDVVSCRIAAEIAALSGQKAELVPQLMQLYSLSAASAQATDARETTERVPLDNSIWAARQTNKG